MVGGVGRVGNMVGKVAKEAGAGEFSARVELPVADVLDWSIGERDRDSKLMSPGI